MTAWESLLQARKAGPLVSIGVLSADLSRLGEQVAAIEAAGAPLLHVDVMDGQFCPMMTAGPPLVKALRTRMLLDVHLMIQEPLGLLEDFVSAGSDMVTVHVESARHIHRALQVLGKLPNAHDAGRGIVRGVALNPGTPVQAIEPLLGDVEMVFLLAINPGWGGQGFHPATADRVAQVRDLARQAQREILIGVDGGITKDNVGEVAAMGADIIVTGSAVFKGDDLAGNIRYMIDTAAQASR